MPEGTDIDYFNLGTEDAVVGMFLYKKIAFVVV